jgi:hypothetical protein
MQTLNIPNSEGQTTSGHQAATDERQARLLKKQLIALARALVGDDDDRRRAALDHLRSAPPALGRAMANRLLWRFHRGDEKTAARAGEALAAAGGALAPVLSEALLSARRPDHQVLMVRALAAAGLGLGEGERGSVVHALFAMLSGKMHWSVRAAALDALVRLRADERPVGDAQADSGQGPPPENAPGRPEGA